MPPREQGVLKLVIEEKSNREIGDTLTIDLPTVQQNVTQIYSKLNVRSRVQATPIPALWRGGLPGSERE